MKKFAHAAVCVAFLFASITASTRLEVVKERVCELKAKGSSRVEFECKAKTEDATTEVEDKIGFKISSSSSSSKGGVKVKVEYEQEIETNVTETETETQYEIVFDRVVEYAKADDVRSAGTADDAYEAYEWGIDAIVSEMPLQDLGGFTEVSTSDDGNMYTFSVGSEDGVATFSFTISQGGDDEALTANKIKIDFELAGYPWVRSDTYAALLCSVESEKEIEIEYNEDDDGEDGKSGRRGRQSEEVVISFDEIIGNTAAGIDLKAFGEFTWAHEAQVLSPMAVNETVGGANGTTVTASTMAAEGTPVIEAMQLGAVDEAMTIRVIATSPPDGSGRLAFSFVGAAARTAADIYWDPEAGVAYSTATNETMTNATNATNAPMEPTAPTSGGSTPAALLVVVAALVPTAVGLLL